MTKHKSKVDQKYLDDITKCVLPIIDQYNPYTYHMLVRDVGYTAASKLLGKRETLILEEYSISWVRSYPELIDISETFDDSY